ncbi:DMT family transporter [Propionibacteriaceae bacterium Y1685]|uniref:DMT family transporter n=1 Tax=Microlunatus sp. Y1700 TaxID=3418487 RepID=UPI003B7C13BB
MPAAQTSPLPTTGPALSSWLPSMLVLGAIWGSSFLLIKIGVQALHPLWVSAGRVTFGAAALGVILLLIRHRLPTDPAAWWHNGVVGVINCAVPFTLLAFAEQRIPSTLAGIWNATTPLIVLPLAVLLFRTESFTPRRIAGLLLGLGGVLIIIGVWHVDGSAADLWGQLLCLGTTSCYAVGICWTRRFISPRPESGTVAAFCQLVTATVVLVPVALIVVRPGQVVSAAPGPLAAVAVLGAIGTGVAFLLNVRNIRMIGASAASAVTYLTPIFATVIGVLVLAEQITWNQPTGALLVLLGVAVAQGIFRRRSPKSLVPLTTATAAETTRAGRAKGEQ